MNFALDTNEYSRLQKGQDRQLSELANKVDEIFLPFIVVAELRAGFKKGSRADQNYDKLDAFLSTPRVSILYADEETVELYAALWVELAVKGTPIPTNDVWIAAICLQYRLSLATSDKHFKQVPLLKTLD